MPSIQRPLAGKTLIFDLDEERTRTKDLVHEGRSARTLVKDGRLRVTIVHLAAGGSIPEHQAPGPITIQTLDGTVTVGAGNADHALAPGRLLVIEQRIPHSVRSVSGGTFLLTLVHPNDIAE
jgi:quercetin dioxygenase-like cupin family protein